MMASLSSADSGRTTIVDLREQQAESWSSALLPALAEARGDARVASVVIAVSPARLRPGQTAPSGLRQLCVALAGCPKVTIVAIEGAHDGWGLGLCTAADLVVAARSVSFRPAVGGEPVEDFWLAYLPLRAVKWLALGAGELSSEEAMRMGVLNALVEDGKALEQALALATSVARVSPDVLHMKKLSNDFRLALPLA